MTNKRLSDSEKKQLLKDILGTNHSAVGNHFPAFSKMIDGLGHFNDAATLLELIPTLGSWMSGGIASQVFSNASFVGIMLFPVQQTINLINANETGVKGYSYRAVAYTITAWAFDKPTPSSSPTKLANLKEGRGHVYGGIENYNKVWRETSQSVVSSLNKKCSEKNVQPRLVKTMFKALANGSSDELCLMILKSFEKEFGHTTKHIWMSGYKVLYPR
jgi:hypothetical protein